jgi:hypothetical protein
MLWLPLLHGGLKVDGPPFAERASRFISSKGSSEFMKTLLAIKHRKTVRRTGVKLEAIG